MFELEIIILAAVITGIIGPVLVTRYRHYLINKRKKDDPVVSSIKANMLIDEQLTDLKNELDCCRIWVSQFHNGGNFYPTGKSIQKFSIFHEQNRPKCPTIRETYTNIPVSLFVKPLNQLYEAGEILIPNYKTSEHYGLATFAEGTLAKSTYIFALNSINDEFIGTLGIEFCSRSKKLDDEQLNEARTKAISIGTLLSTYLYETPKK